MLVMLPLMCTIKKGNRIFPPFSHTQWRVGTWFHLQNERYQQFLLLPGYSNHEMFLLKLPAYFDFFLNKSMRLSCLHIHIQAWSQNTRHVITVRFMMPANETKNMSATCHEFSFDFCWARLESASQTKGIREFLILIVISHMNFMHCMVFLVFYFKSIIC